MRQPADAIVTGFVKSPVLLARSLAPLRALKQQGILRNIHYVTWDSAEIDACVAPLADMTDIKLLRVPQPRADGSPNQRGVVYQVRNLDGALAQVAEDDTLVLKSRPDVVADTGFLREKIDGFDLNCAVPTESSILGVTMPKPVLREKIWIPWADSNQPFFYEDAVFLGRKRDLRKLVTKLSPRDLEILGDADCGWYAHVVRYARIFVDAYPLFRRYLRDFHYFPNDLAYRRTLMSRMLDDAFFWHLLVAHAWILHTQFHVDAGERGDLSFYANAVNRNADWSRPETLRIAMPYDNIDVWRAGTRAGLVLPSLHRAYGRLMDDAWQAALFTRTPPDFRQGTLTGLLTNIAQCGDGRLRSLEDDFYHRMAAALRAHRQTLDQRSA